MLKKERMVSIQSGLEKADKGDADAQFRISREYRHSQDYEEEVKWLKKSSEQGNNDALERIAFLKKNTDNEIIRKPSSSLKNKRRLRRMITDRPRHENVPGTIRTAQGPPRTRSFPGSAGIGPVCAFSPINAIRNRQSAKKTAILSSTGCKENGTHVYLFREPRRIGESCTRQEKHF